VSQLQTPCVHVPGEPLSQSASLSHQHTPFPVPWSTQANPSGHLRPQAPQLFTSLARLRQPVEQQVHVGLHAIPVAGQVHFELEPEPPVPPNPLPPVPPIPPVPPEPPAPLNAVQVSPRLHMDTFPALLQEHRPVDEVHAPGPQGETKLGSHSQSDLLHLKPLLHVLPQEPQLVWVSAVSHPLSRAGTSGCEQLTKPEVQTDVHALLEQLSADAPVVAHCLPHCPQLNSSILTSTSQPLEMSPSQSPNPATQLAIVQLPPAHPPMAWGGLGQTVPH